MIVNTEILERSRLSRKSFRKMKKFQVSDLFSHSLHFATDLIKSKSFALSGEASKPGSNGQAKLVTVQIKRVGGFKHRKAHAAYFHHSKAPTTPPVLRAASGGARATWKALSLPEEVGGISFAAVSQYVRRQCAATRKCACGGEAGGSEALGVEVPRTSGTEATPQVPPASESPWGMAGGRN